jgi:pyridoxine 4-dehydrogenase
VPTRTPDTIALGEELIVRRLGFGALRITGEGCKGPPGDPAAARALLRRVVDLGIDLIDTADSYGPEVSENLIAEALHPYPEGLVIATKGGLLGPRPHDARPERLRQCCIDSLRRLRLERIDLYQLHAPDPAVPFEESLGALVELRKEGMIREIGVCNVTVEQLERAREVADVVAVQNRFSLGDRHSEPVLRICERESLAFLPWFPLMDGVLARGGGAVIDGVARQRGATFAQVALAWLLRHSPVMLPIPGTSSLEHLEENYRATTIELSDDDIRRLDEGLSHRGVPR